MHREGLVNGMVPHDSTLCRVQYLGVNPEGRATGEGPDDTGRIRCELYAQSCAAGGLDHKREMTE